METQQKKRVLSMIQPTGTFTLGNYLGALKNFVALQDWQTFTLSPSVRSLLPFGRTPCRLTP